MATLAEMTLETALLCAEIFQGTATGGSTSTLVDLACDEPDGFYDRGTIWFLSGNNNGKSAIINHFDRTTRTFTFATQSAACAAGNHYAACASPYSRGLLIQAVNQALQAVGRVILLDTSLSGADGLLEHTLPTGVTEVRRVAQRPGGGGSGEERNYHWRTVNGKIYFDKGKEPKTGETIAIYHKARHAKLENDTDEINALVSLELLKWTAAAAAHRIRYNIQGEADASAPKKLAEALQRAAEMRILYPPLENIPRDPHLAN